MEDRDILAAYLNDQLSPNDKAAFEADLAQRPDLQAELGTMQATVATIAEGGPTQTQRDNGWARLSAEIAQAPSTAAPANINAKPNILQIAGIAAAAILAWQFLAVPFLPSSQSEPFLTASEMTSGPALRVAFSADVNFGDVAQVLRASGANMVDGPTATSLFTIVFADEAALIAAQDAFANQPDLFTMVTRP